MNDCQHQNSHYIFKLRSNISIEGDVELARREISTFFSRQSVKPITRLSDILSRFPALSHVKGVAAAESFLRDGKVKGYLADGDLSLLPELIRELSFVQHLYVITKCSPHALSWIEECKQQLGPVIECKSADDILIAFAVTHYAIIEFSDIIARRAKNVNDVRSKLKLMLHGLLTQTDCPRASNLAREVVTAKTSTSHCFHDLHYYKAKFFPRLVRSTLNISRHILNISHPRVIDNFSGSGTTMIEAAKLGMPSLGIDIDPLSVLIAQSKIQALQFSSDALAEQGSLVMDALETCRVGQLPLFHNAIRKNEKVQAEFPAWLMKNRKMTNEIADTLLREMLDIRNAIDRSGVEFRDFFMVLLSDAIARKIRMRFLGTGVGRFSLTFSKRSMVDLFRSSVSKSVRVAAAVEWLRKTINLTFAEANAQVGDARTAGKELGSFDVLLTSPPYIPAASGRESYAQARAPSLIALQLKTPEELNRLVDDSIGSMNGNAVDVTKLSRAERQVVEWLKKDELRYIKAYPTARYFLDMRRAFNRMHEYLSHGAVAVIVSGRQSTFYNFKTRKELYVVQSAEILAEEAENMGFEVIELHNVQLSKANMNARPRSLDEYYETLIWLRRP